MFNLDPSKLLVIAIVTIIVLGPDRLPQFARQIGGAWRSFSEFRQRMESQVRSSVPDLPSTTELLDYARSPTALLNRLAASDPVDDSAAHSLGATGDLPPIDRSDRAHWTTIASEASIASHDGCRSVDAPRNDAEKAWIEPIEPFVGDAALN
jgi:Sec-independent protein translocase protein TatA